MKWFSIDGIRTEIERVRWPHGEEFKTSIADVLTFTVSLAAFFVVCDLLVAQILKIVGM